MDWSHLQSQQQIRVELSDAEIPDEWVWERLRIKRNTMLQQSDWTQILDAPVNQQAWATYRQELRDLPETTDDPREAVWPEPPTD
jgi:hypothetical protein